MTKQTTVRLPEELAEQAEAVARVKGTSVNALIVDSLAAEVDARTCRQGLHGAGEGADRAGQGVARPPRQVTRYLTLAEYFWLAEQVTSTGAAVLLNASRTDLADSALHAPAAGFGGDDFYPDLFEKAAVLTCRLAWNHPLPDGRRRGRSEPRSV